MGWGGVSPPNTPESQITLWKTLQKSHLLEKDHFLSSFSELPAGRQRLEGSWRSRWDWHGAAATPQPRGSFGRGARSLQLRSCCLMLPAGSWEHPDLRCRWERRDLAPPLLVPQASGSPVFLLFSGEAAQLVIVMRLERLGAEQGLEPPCAAAGSSRSSTLFSICFSCHCSGRN